MLESRVPFLLHILEDSAFLRERSSYASVLYVEELPSAQWTSQLLKLKHQHVTLILRLLEHLFKGSLVRNVVV